MPEWYAERNAKIYHQWLDGSPKRDICERWQLAPLSVDKIIYEQRAKERGVRTAAKVDANHLEIVTALRRAGYWCQSTASMGKGFPDVLVKSKANRLALFEIKTPAGKLTADEREWHERFDGPVYVVRSIEEALNVMRGLDE